LKKVLIASWLIIVIGFSGVLLYSTAYEMDAYYTVINFQFQISEVVIIQNETGDMTNLRLSASVSNPSLFSSITLNFVDSTVILNGRGTSYLRGTRWLVKDIPPSSSFLVSWGYSILTQDLSIIQDANTSGIWSWYILIELNLDTPIVGIALYDRSQPFQGVIVE
jgi:hypothetical protein